MNRKILFLLLGLILIGSSVFVWFHFKHLKDESIKAQLITVGQKRQLTNMEIEAINRQKADFPQVEVNTKLPQTMPAGIRDNFKTINEVQKINQMNRKQQGK